MNSFATLWQSLVTGQWSLTFSTPAEWVATLLSLFGFYWCILKKPSSFLVFMAADLIWLGTATLHQHWSLVAQQLVYLIMNWVGYKLWIADQIQERQARARLEALEDEVMMLSAQIDAASETDEEQPAAWR